MKFRNTDIAGIEFIIYRVIFQKKKSVLSVNFWKHDEVARHDRTIEGRLFFFFHRGTWSADEECESCTRQRLEQRVQLHTATWQLGLKRASSRPLFQSACCPTSVMLLDLPTIPLMPFELPTPFEPRFRAAWNEIRWIRSSSGKRGEEGESSRFSFESKFSMDQDTIYDFFLNFELLFNNLFSLKTKEKHHWSIDQV